MKRQFDQASATRVTNTFTGKVRGLIQVGVVNGGFHVHLPRYAGAAMLVAALGLPVLLALVVPSDVPRQSVVAPVHPVEVSTVTVNVLDGRTAAAEGITIAIDSVSFTSTDNGNATCVGVDNHPGTCTAFANGTASGSSTVGVIDFSVTTPALTCRTSGVHVSESVVLAQASGAWTRVLLRAMGPNDREGHQLPVTFEVSRGHRGPAPQSPKTCAPS
ncbi:hypothetical protein [Amycolatopsis sp. NPDC059021]|uniref:hypothetical protein n=1 Tax=Amycolatopsis sp. NPDC059021 TaxID=3346704 RepID=UPI00366C46E0